MSLPPGCRTRRNSSRTRAPSAAVKCSKKLEANTVPSEPAANGKGSSADWISGLHAFFPMGDKIGVHVQRPFITGGGKTREVAVACAEIEQPGVRVDPACQIAAQGAPYLATFRIERQADAMVFAGEGVAALSRVLAHRCKHCRDLPVLDHAVVAGGSHPLARPADVPVRDPHGGRRVRTDFRPARSWQTCAPPDRGAPARGRCGRRGRAKE